MRFFSCLSAPQTTISASYLQQLLGEDGYRNLALYHHPHFPSRAFWHTSIYLRADRGISKPEDSSWERSRLVCASEAVSDHAHARRQKDARR